MTKNKLRVIISNKQKDVEKVLPKLSGTTSEMIKQALQMMLSKRVQLNIRKSFTLRMSL